MTPTVRGALSSVLLICGLVAAPLGAAARLADLSSGIVRYPPAPEPAAVYGYDPTTSRWMELKGVTWQVVTTSPGHAGYVVEATAPLATSVSTYRVVMDVIGSSVEVFMTPAVMQQLGAGETATLHINLF